MGLRVAAEWDTALDDAGRQMPGSVFKNNKPLSCLPMTSQQFGFCKWKWIAPVLQYLHSAVSFQGPCAAFISMAASKKMDPIQKESELTIVNVFCLLLNWYSFLNKVLLFNKCQTEQLAANLLVMPEQDLLPTNVINWIQLCLTTPPPHTHRGMYTCHAFNDGVGSKTALPSLQHPCH